MEQLDGNTAALNAYQQAEDESWERSEYASQMATERIESEAQVLADAAMRDGFGTQEWIGALMDQAEAEGSEDAYITALTIFVNRVRQLPYTLSHLTAEERDQATKELFRDTLKDCAKAALEVHREKYEEQAAEEWA